MIKLARLDRVETKLRNDLAAKRLEYQRKAQTESLAAELGITYDKACELLLHYEREQQVRRAELLLNMKRQRIKYVKREELNGLLSSSDVNGFDIEATCDEDD